MSDEDATDAPQGEQPDGTAATPSEGEAPAAKAPTKRARKPAKAKAKAAADGEPAAAEQEGAPATAEPTAEAADGEKPAAKKAAAKKPAARRKAPAGEKAAAPAATAEKAPAEKAAAEKPAKAAPAARGKGKAAPKAPRRRVVRAHARYVRTSARKARLVCVHLRGKSVQEARAILAFTPREVARDWSKLLESAVANAESNHELLEDDLIVREAYADEGPTIKRFRPRAMGRATPIRKRTSHLTITLSARP